MLSPVIMQQDSFFEGADERVVRPAESLPAGPVRLERADRHQCLLGAVSIDELIPDDHRARLFWSLLEDLDLSGFQESIRSRAGGAGRPAIDPRVLLCIWLFAISEGVGSARQVARLCERDAVYRWICGGLSPCFRTLSTFRIAHGKALDGLMTDLLAMLVHSGKVRLRRVAQDGCRVRADAAASSFHRERSFKKNKLAARDQVKATLKQLDAPGTDDSARKAAAKERAEREREKVLEKARRELQKLRESHPDTDPEEVRVSTTDPECRVMRMADNGYRPSYNVQSCVDTESRVIVGLSVTNSGSDLNQLGPMMQQVLERVGTQPSQALVDAGYTKKADIEAQEALGIEVFAPQNKNRKGDLSKPRWDDGPGVAQWRKRMTTPEAQQIYKVRGSTIETVFADWRRWRGLQRLPVRGIDKVNTVMLLFGLTYNLMRVISLGGLT